MLKSTTSAQKALDNPAQGDIDASAYYEQVCALPPNMSNTVPSFGFMQDLCDGWLGKLLGRVTVHHTKQENKDYYLITLRVLLRKHSFVLVPFSAYMHANAIAALQRMDIVDHMVVEGEKTGSIYIPKWSRRKVYDECRAIALAHKEEVKGHLAMIDSFQTKDDGSVAAVKH